jgi:hypothetical protein
MLARTPWEGATGDPTAKNGGYTPGKRKLPQVRVEKVGKALYC